MNKITKEAIPALLPCPFCGSEPRHGSLAGDEQNWCIWCPECQCAAVDTTMTTSLEDIEQMWNTRATQEQIDVNALKIDQFDERVLGRPIVNQRAWREYTYVKGYNAAIDHLAQKGYLQNIAKSENE